MVSVCGVAISQHGLRYNCAAVVASGEILGLVPKEKLPTYNIFYEGRTFSRGHARHRARSIAACRSAICSSSSISASSPPRSARTSGARTGRLAAAPTPAPSWCCNLSASPFRVGIVQTRRELIATRAADHQCTLAYANLVGANDGLIFDGGGFVNQNGKMLHEAPRFQRGLRDLRRRSRPHRAAARREHHLARRPGDYIDVAPAAAHDRDSGRDRRPSESRATLTYPGARPPQLLPARPKRRREPPREELCEDILDALALGVGDYFEKTGAFKLIGIALSGGRDSLLTLLIAHRYANRVAAGEPGQAAPRLLHAVALLVGRRRAMRRRRSAEELGVPLEIVSIDDAFERELAAAQQMLGAGRRSDRAHASRTSRPACARSACGTGPTPSAGSSCRPAT